MKLFNAIAAVALATSSFAAAPLPSLNPTDYFGGFKARLSSQVVDPDVPAYGMLGFSVDVSMFSFSLDFGLAQKKYAVTDSSSAVTTVDRKINSMALALDYFTPLADGLKASVGAYYAVSVSQSYDSKITGPTSKIKLFGPAIGLDQKLGSKASLFVKLPMVSVKNWAGVTQSTAESYTSTNMPYKGWIVSSPVIGISYAL